MRASGKAGSLRVGYQIASRLGEWSITLAPVLPMTAMLRARIRDEHPYWSTQRPIDVVLVLGTVEWIWRGVTVSRDGDSIVVMLHERPIVEARRELDVG